MVGNHIILDMWGINEETLSDISLMSYIFEEMAKEGNFTVLKMYLHRFEPHGLTGIMLLSESHVSIHTYPEHDGLATVDLYTCGNTAQPEKALFYLMETLKPKKCKVQRFPRGEEE